MREQSYIIRIYRQSGKTAGMDSLDGIVEMPESGLRAAFHDAQGLWVILTGNPHDLKNRRKTTSDTAISKRDDSQYEPEE